MGVANWLWLFLREELPLPDSCLRTPGLHCTPAVAYSGSTSSVVTNCLNSSCQSCNLFTHRLLGLSGSAVEKKRWQKFLLLKGYS